MAPVHDDDPNTVTTFRGALKRETSSELLRALGYSASPARTVLVTALGALSREAKADLIQFLQGARPEPQGAPVPVELQPAVSCTCKGENRSGTAQLCPGVR